MRYNVLFEGNRVNLSPLFQSGNSAKDNERARVHWLKVLAQGEDDRKPNIHKVSSIFAVHDYFLKHDTWQFRLSEDGIVIRNSGGFESVVPYNDVIHLRGGNPYDMPVGLRDCSNEEKKLLELKKYKAQVIEDLQSSRRLEFLMYASGFLTLVTVPFARDWSIVLSLVFVWFAYLTEGPRSIRRTINYDRELVADASEKIRDYNAQIDDRVKRNLYREWDWRQKAEVNRGTFVVGFDD